MKREWWQWPANVNDMYVPWYVTLRRAVAYPFVMLGLALTFVFVLLGYGWKQAVEFWKRSA